jgi:hypothetical protein
LLQSLKDGQVLFSELVHVRTRLCLSEPPDDAYAVVYPIQDLSQKTVFDKLAQRFVEISISFELSNVIAIFVSLLSGLQSSLQIIQNGIWDR